MEVALDISLRNTSQRRSFSSEDDAESIYSVQEKETDVVQDTDSEDCDGFSSTSTLEVEYEVATSDSDDATAALFQVLLGNGADGVSSSGEEDMNVTAAIAAVLCDSSLEAWATDGEDSDTTIPYNDSGTSGSAPTTGPGADFWTCVQCNGRNDQPKVRYCDKCFQRCWQCNTKKSYNCFPLCNDCYKVRKSLFPPRPRGTRKRKMERQAAEEAQITRKRRASNSSDDRPVKLTALQHCLSGLSQDSGLGSSQEIPGLNFDVIILPNQQGIKRRRVSDVEDHEPSKLPRLDLHSLTDVNNLPSTSKTVIGNTAIINPTNRTTSDSLDVVKTTTTIVRTNNSVASDIVDVVKTTTVVRTNNSVAHSNETKSDSIPAKSTDVSTSSKSCDIATSHKIPSESKTDVATSHLESLKSAHVARSSKISTSLEELNTIDRTKSIDFDVASSTSTKSANTIHSNSDLGSEAHSSRDSVSVGPLPELKELCIICNVSPKNGIFLHGKIAHLCCCYKCAMKTWRISKRCPICNCKVKNVVKVFTT